MTANKTKQMARNAMLNLLRNLDPNFTASEVPLFLDICLAAKLPLSETNVMEHILVDLLPIAINILAALTTPLP
jgi:hypothetical protein